MGGLGRAEEGGCVGVAEGDRRTELSEESVLRLIRDVQRPSGHCTSLGPTTRPRNLPACEPRTHMVGGTKTPGRSVGIYKECVRKTRFVKIRKLWEQCNPQATICYVGESYRENIKKLFHVRSEWVQLDEGVFHHNERHIVITPHFSRIGMSNAKAAVVQHQLRTWEVKLPM